MPDSKVEPEAAPTSNKPNALTLNEAFGACSQILERLPDDEQRRRVLRALTIVFEE